MFPWQHILETALMKHLCTKFEQNRTRNKEVAEMAHNVIVTSFLKIAQQFFVLE